MIGPRVYVFGGHAHGEFFNDIWSFDLSTRTPAPSSTAVCNSLTACLLCTVISKLAWEQLDPPKGTPRHLGVRRMVRVLVRRLYPGRGACAAGWACGGAVYFTQRTSRRTSYSLCLLMHGEM